MRLLAKKACGGPALSALERRHKLKATLLGGSEQRAVPEMVYCALGSGCEVSEARTNGDCDVLARDIASIWADTSASLAPGTVRTLQICGGIYIGTEHYDSSNSRNKKCAMLAYGASCIRRILSSHGARTLEEACVEKIPAPTLIVGLNDAREGIRRLKSGVEAFRTVVKDVVEMASNGEMLL
ncbi:hypothetical protein GJ744_007964 [Endocarpon pusillum]|uniref:Uncharacterized protein n=1 Tax=Endocarpon pusillum TaxID=364733 RepID=A0A8H7AK14_9EURO|nr:hypothetical protein GJ744_007964 [Endocarpon pusillum]